MTDDMLDGITKAMAKKGYYNTYCFTKHVAEVKISILMGIIDLRGIVLRTH